MTPPTFTLYPMTTHYVLDEPKAGDVEIDALTPAQQRAIARSINQAMDRELVRVLSGGYDVQTNRAGQKGTTFEHVRRPRALLPDSR